MPPDEAQAAVDAVPPSRLWQIDDSQPLVWPEADLEKGAVQSVQAFALKDLDTVFRGLQSAGWMRYLVGGQAVNLWASRYDRDLPPWQELRPYTSRDLDYYGGLAEARLAMRVLSTGAGRNSDDPAPNAGTLVVPLADGRELVVDILTSSTAAAEVERTAVTFSAAARWRDSPCRSSIRWCFWKPRRLRSAACRKLIARTPSTCGSLCSSSTRGCVTSWTNVEQCCARWNASLRQQPAATACTPCAQGIDLVQAIPLDDMRPAGGFTWLLGAVSAPDAGEDRAKPGPRRWKALREQDP